MDLTKLLAELAAIDAKIDALLTNDNLTEQQTADHDALIAERAKAVASIQKERDRLARAEQRASLEADAEDARKASEAAAKRKERSVPQPGDRRVTLPDVPADLPSRIREAAPRIPATAKRFGQLKHFAGIKGGRDADERAYRFGQFGLAMLAHGIPGRFAMLPKFREAQDFMAREWLPEMQAVNNSNDGNGANFLIPTEFSMDMVDLRERYGVARRLLRMEAMTSDHKVIPRRSGGLTAYPIAESAAATESTKTWDQVSLTAKDWVVLSRYSGQVNADAAINFGDDLAGECAYAFSYAEDNCAFNGDTTSTYAGINGIRNKLKNTGTAGVATQGTSNTWSALVLGDFDAVVGLLPQYADTPNAAWVMHRTFYYSVVEKLVQAAGGVPAYEVRQGMRGRPIFKGYPVEFSQVMPSATATSSLVCTLGDYSLGAAFGDRQQESIAFSEHASVGSQSVFERNQIAIRAIERFDINVHDCGSSTAAGPIVGLKTGS